MSKKKAPEAEPPENHERWIVSYADMLTLLFALFFVTDGQRYAVERSGTVAETRTRKINGLDAAGLRNGGEFRHELSGNEYVSR